MLSRISKPEWITRLLLLGLWVGLLGAFKPVVFNEGSPMAKYIAKQSQLEMVAEEEVEDYFEAVLYGEGEAALGGDGGVKLIESVPEPERREHVERIFLLDRWLVGFLAVGSLLLLSPKLRRETPVRHVLPVLSLWLVVQAVGSTLNGGEPFTHLAVFAHATRWALPLVLWWMLFERGNTNPDIGVGGAVAHFIVVSTSLTFAIHGWEAIRLNPFFQDLIFGSGMRFGLQVPTGVNEFLLRAIGCMDVVLAVLILFYRRPEIFRWMALWGLITALSRPLAIGADAWAEVPVRAANFFLPLILFVMHAIPAQNLKRKAEHPKERSYE